MELITLVACGFYLLILFIISFAAQIKTNKIADFTLGKRSLNYFVTALSAHASDMSSWLFMGLPAAIYSNGLIEIWAAVGLTLFMYLNWHFIAPRLRIATEKYHSNTIPTFFANRFQDATGLLRVTSATFCIIYFIFYISAGLVALGLLFESIFNVPYIAGILISLVAVFFILLGGFLSVAWIDFFQGIFLLLMIILVPIVVFFSYDKSIFLNSILQENAGNYFFSIKNIKESLFLVLGWGLGYFGQPHILTKFMGIKDIKKLRYAKIVGISWQILALCGAIFVGIAGLSIFKKVLSAPQLMFVYIVKEHFPSFVAGLILCAIIAAAINVMSSQILVLTSVVAEDFYKIFFLKQSSKTVNSVSTDSINSKKITFVSRLFVLFFCLIAWAISIYSKDKKIYDLVLYAWTGLGCSIGPALILALRSSIKNKYAIFIGMLVGGISSGMWIFFDKTIPAMIPCFILSFLSIFFVEGIFRGKCNTCR